MKELNLLREIPRREEKKERIINGLTEEERFIYNSVNINGDMHIPWHSISESIRAVWRKIYRERNGIKS